MLEGDPDRAVAAAGVDGVDGEVEGVGAPTGAGEDQVNGFHLLLRLTSGGGDDRLAEELPAADDGVGRVLLVGRGLAVVVDEGGFEPVVAERLDVEAVQQVAELQHGKSLLELGARLVARSFPAYLTRETTEGKARETGGGTARPEDETRFWGIRGRLHAHHLKTARRITTSHMPIRGLICPRGQASPGSGEWPSPLSPRRGRAAFPRED